MEAVAKGAALFFKNSKIIPHPMDMVSLMLRSIQKKLFIKLKYSFHAGLQCPA